MYVHLYKNNPTVGLTDGNLVSEGDGSNPITCNPLSVTVGEESTSIKLAVRTAPETVNGVLTNYKTSGSTTIAPIGTTKDNWALSLDGITWLAYGAMLTITAEITAVNTIIYAKCKSVTGEVVANDTSVDLQIVGKILAV